MLHGVQTATQTLHRLTCYSPERAWDVAPDDPAVVAGLVVNDLARLPWFFKRYPADLPRLALPTGLPAAEAPTLEVLAGTAAVAPGALDLAQLARLLFLAAGVVRTMPRPYGAHPFRAAGSAGGRFPLELYVAVPAGGALPAGVHAYDAEHHALVTVAAPPTGDAPAVVVTGVPWRTGWRYRERGWRHLYWDAGTMLAQLLAAAASAGVPADLYSVFADAAVAGLVGADRRHELPLAVVGLGGAPALSATGPAAAGALDGNPVEFGLVTAAQRAGEADALGAPWPAGAAVSGVAAVSAPLEDVVRARGSQRRMDPTRGLPEATLVTSLAVALRGVDLPHWVVVHDVTGVPPGLYRWPDLATPLRAGDMREELYRVCLEQGLARDAAFVAIAATAVAGLDDHGYRDAQLAAGLVEGRLHLAAYALGASATGMTFLDSEIPSLLAAAVDGLLFTCVGVPAYRSAPGGAPGAPTTVRRVEPRD